MSDNKPIDQTIVDWWLALSGRKPGAEKDDLEVPPASQVGASSTKEKNLLGGRVTFNGEYDWKYIKAFTIKMGLWLVDINLGAMVNIKLAASFFAKGAAVSLGAGLGLAVDWENVKTRALFESLNLDVLKAAAGRTEVHLAKVNSGVARIGLLLKDMTAAVEATEAKAQKMEALVNKMETAVAKQRVDLSAARAVGQQSDAVANRAVVSGSSDSLTGSKQSINASSVGGSGTGTNVSGSESSVSGVSSDSSTMINNVSVYNGIG